MKLEEKMVKINKVYEGRILSLYNDDVLLPNGKSSKREYVSHNGASAVLPIDEKGFVYLVRQYRYAYGEEVLEIPAGKIEKGEDPKLCAVRELSEETGWVAEDVRLITCLYPSPGYTNERIYVFLAKVRLLEEAHADENEFLELEKYPLEEAYSMVLSGKIKDSKSICAISIAMIEKLKGTM